MARLLVAGSRHQAFLDRWWIPWLLRTVPEGLRRPLALRLLALSPHYFSPRWAEGLSAGSRTSDLLDAEYERNRLSRREISDRLLRGRVRPDMTVLDFGCGAGFLAREVAPYVGEVLALDVSRGAIACAEVLRPGPNVSYIATSGGHLADISDASVDLLYSFAVLQHLDRSQAATVLAEFARVLRPGATGLCHFAMGEPGSHQGAWSLPRSKRSRLHSLRLRYSLRYDYYSLSEVRQLLAGAGLVVEGVVPIETIASIDDDVGREHLAIFSAP